MTQEDFKKDEIDLWILLSDVWSGKWTIVFFVVLFSGAAVLYSLSLPNVFKSEVLLAPVDKGQSLGNLQGQLGGLASLAGINLGNGSGSDTQIAIEILKSRGFVKTFIEKHDILPDLMAVKNWDMNSNTIVYDKDIYNPETKEWTREVKMPFTPTPSMLEAHEEFIKLLDIYVNQDTGMVVLSLTHVSPFIAQEWASLLVEEVNLTMKDRDVVEAEKSTAFLTNQLSKTQITDIREVLYKLVEEQAKTIMFASVRDEYVFKTIDPAFIPEIKSGPKRAIICILSALFGCFIGVFIVLLRSFTGSQSKKS